MVKLNYILEVGAEEIPAGYFEAVLDALKNNLTTKLTEERLAYEKIKIWGSPRRLALAIWNLDEKQIDFTEKVTGPPKAAAFDKDNKPTKAFAGFIKTHNVNKEDVTIIETKKGEYLAVEKTIKGLMAKEILLKIVPEVLANLPFPKTMRWGSGKHQFVRPVHWLLSVLGNEVLPIKFAGAVGNNLTYGHRFLAPEKIIVETPTEYVEKLAKNYVEVDYKKRLKMIEEDITKVLKKAQKNIKIIEDQELLEEIANLVEDPVAVLGSFEKEYLKLPLAVASTAMKEHQRYFTLVDEKGNLAPYFMAVSNTRAKDMQVVARGHERVLRARLDDAKFYYFDDLKKPLIDYKEDLKNVVFHNLLGTIWDKTERVKTLALKINENLNLGLNEKDLKTAADLLKCDLVTGVVKEFPTLQGLMGEDYALNSGEKPEVALAIKEHYRPLRAGGELPSSNLAAVLSISDKIDTIVACFAVGLIPTGAADPFALRRQVLGVLNICLAKLWPISVADLVLWAYEPLKNLAKKPFAETKEEALNFIKTRFKGYLLAHNISNDVSEAVLTLYATCPLAAYKRAVALENFKNKTDFLNLAQTFKRVVNIIKKENIEEEFNNWSLLSHKSEENLLKTVQEFESKIENYLKEEDYESLISNFTSLKKPVDDFFNDVLVNDADENLRRARLALLKRISKTFEVVADFSQVSTPN